MLKQCIPILATALFALSLSPLSSSLAEESLDAPLEEGGERCVDMRRISRTEVIDDHNILFHMRGGVIYRNYLPHRCPGLKRRDAFMYRTTISRLCNIDVITVLYDYGFGFTPGPSCGLGMFHEISKDEAQALKEPRDLEPEPIPPAEPEEPGLEAPEEGDKE